jgi:predicted alpha/beta-hydrolase family hydrolase
VTERLKVEVGDHKITALTYAARGPLLVLAHGAGASQASAFMVHAATYLASRGIEVMTFDFVYTARKKKVPDSPALLEAAYRAVLAVARERAGGRALFVGGKSMGGRIASQIAVAERDVRGLVFLGYPLHPPGKPRDEKAPPRAQHLRDVACPMLFVQGTRDAFGTDADVRRLLPSLAPGSEVYAVEGGDHSFVVAKKSLIGVNQADVETGALEAVVRWVNERG